MKHGLNTDRLTASFICVPSVFHPWLTRLMAGDIETADCRGSKGPDHSTLDPRKSASSAENLFLPPKFGAVLFKPTAPRRALRTPCGTRARGAGWPDRSCPP